MAAYDAALLLSPKFFLRFRSAVEEIARKAAAAQTEPFSSKSQKRLENLFNATQSYARWTGVVIGATKEIDFPTFALPVVRYRKLYRLRREPHRGRKKAGKRAEIEHGAAVHFKATLEKVKVSARSLGDYASCYPCCYENKPRGCRSKYDSDPDVCFTNCIDGKLRK